MEHWTAPSSHRRTSQEVELEKNPFEIQTNTHTPDTIVSDPVQEQEVEDPRADDETYPIVGTREYGFRRNRKWDRDEELQATPEDDREDYTSVVHSSFWTESKSGLAGAGRAELARGGPRFGAGEQWTPRSCDRAVEDREKIWSVRFGIGF